MARIKLEMEEIIEGTGFDGSFADFLHFLRSFHDQVLANGSVPIAVLESLVEEWINKQQ